MNYEFKLKNSAAYEARNINKDYGDNVVTRRYNGGLKIDFRRQICPKQTRW